MNNFLFSQTLLTRAVLGSPHTSVGWGGSVSPLSNFRTNKQTEKREKAIENYKREDFSALRYATTVAYVGFHLAHHSRSQGQGPGFTLIKP